MATTDQVKPLFLYVPSGGKTLAVVTRDGDPQAISIDTVGGTNTVIDGGSHDSNYGGSVPLDGGTP